MTPLLWASRNGARNTLALLLQRGAHLDVADTSVADNSTSAN